MLLTQALLHSSPEEVRFNQVEIDLTTLVQSIDMSTDPADIEVQIQEILQRLIVITTEYSAD